jgi:hypothetical protein
MANWLQVHQESPRASLNIEAWQQEEKKNLLFVRDEDGLRVSVYSCAEDALDGKNDFALAEVCYGWYTLLWEQGKREAHSDFLDDCDTRSAAGHNIPFACHDHPGECEDAFHAAQVILENEECEGCDICTEHRVSVPEALA